MRAGLAMINNRGDWGKGRQHVVASRVLQRGRGRVSQQQKQRGPGVVRGRESVGFPVKTPPCFLEMNFVRAGVIHAGSDGLETASAIPWV